jgi:dTDP-L-rhamnose 4-epimerase
MLAATGKLFYSPPGSLLGDIVRKVLITGGAGFIGSSLTRRLAAEGWEVTVLDNLSPQIHTDNPANSPLFCSIAGSAHFIRGDVTDRATLECALAGQHAVVHFAAETGTGQSMYQIDHYSRVNIGATSLMLDILTNAPHSIKRIVVASSRSIYGEGKYLTARHEAVFPGPRSAEDMSIGDFEPKVPGAGTLTATATDELSKIHPSSVYGITKQVQEQLILTVCPAIGIEGVALRYQNVFGPGQSLTNPYTGILSIFSNLIMSGKPINIFEDGRESRDFIFIDDVVEATVASLIRADAANQVFNVGTGTPVDVETVARTLMRLLGREVDMRISGDFRLGDIRNNYACMEKARQLLGFAPRYDFETGIAAFTAWASASGPQESGYEKSIAEMKARGLFMVADAA